MSESDELMRMGVFEILEFERVHSVLLSEDLGACSLACMSIC